jgi:hypothetical protein
VITRQRRAAGVGKLECLSNSRSRRRIGSRASHQQRVADTGGENTTFSSTSCAQQVETRPA